MELNNYNVIKKLGSGGFGTVWQAVNKITGEIVAVKILKERFSSWEKCLNLPEVNVVRKVMKHANIVKLKEVILQDSIVYLVFEYMEGNNLYNLMEKKRQPFSEAEVKKWSFQVFQGLAYVHRCGFVHRDIKPDNLLLTKDNNAKIADFGLALDIKSPNRQNYIGTRYYRAPEILLCSRNYGYAVDIWAMGATMAELLGFHPLFPGLNEADQLGRICSVIGSPKVGEWDEGFELAGVFNYKFPHTAGVDLSRLIPSASEDAIDLIKLLCSWDPRKRPIASQVLRHRFFIGVLCIPQSLRPKVPAAAATAYGSRRFGYGNSREQYNFYEEDEWKKSYTQNEQIDLLRSVMQQRRNLIDGPRNYIANRC